MKFRFNRGTLEESMRTCQEVYSMRGLQALISQHFGDTISDLTFEYVGFDERIGWYTYHVKGTSHGVPEQVIIGMSDSGTFLATPSKQTVSATEQPVEKKIKHQRTLICSTIEFEDGSTALAIDVAEMTDLEVIGLCEHLKAKALRSLESSPTEKVITIQ